MIPRRKSSGSFAIYNSKMGELRLSQSAKFGELSNSHVSPFCKLVETEDLDEFRGSGNIELGKMAHGRPSTPPPEDPKTLLVGKWTRKVDERRICMSDRQ